MYWDEVLDYAQGIMTFEALENSRTSLPMTDSAGLKKYNDSMKKQLREIWNLMFPKTVDETEETEERRRAFATKREVYRGLRERINEERGIK